MRVSFNAYGVFPSDKTCYYPFLWVDQTQRLCVLSLYLGDHINKSTGKTADNHDMHACYQPQTGLLLTILSVDRSITPREGHLDPETRLTPCQTNQSLSQSMTSPPEMPGGHAPCQSHGSERSLIGSHCMMGSVILKRFGS